MVTPASGNGRFQSVETDPGRGTKVWATVRLTSAKVSASLLKQPAFEPRSHIMVELAQLGGGVADAEVAPSPQVPVQGGDGLDEAYPVATPTG